MNLEEVKSFFNSEDGKKEDVISYIQGFITPDRVNKFMETEDGKKLIQPKLDQFFTKGLDTWKTNNLQKLIDDALAKANPQETPEQKQIRELTERLNKKEADEKKQTLINKAILKSDEKKLPKELVEYFLGQDEDSTYKNLETLEKVFTTHVNSIVEEKLKSGYRPPKDGGSTDPELEKIRKIMGL